MRAAFTRMARLPRDERGSMAIETAFVAPVLLMLALGGFEVSTMVARQTELQSAAAEAAAVVRAVISADATARDTVRDIVATSLCGNNAQTVTNGVASCGTVTVEITPVYRCGTATAYTATAGSCGVQPENRFIQLEITDTYTPIWANYGIGTGFDYYVNRTVQIG